MTENVYPPYMAGEVAGRGADVEGATIEEAGPELAPDEGMPDDSFDRDSDGTPVGQADADADAARGRPDDE